MKFTKCSERLPDESSPKLWKFNVFSHEHHESGYFIGSYLNKKPESLVYSDGVNNTPRFLVNCFESWGVLPGVDDEND